MLHQRTPISTLNVVLSSFALDPPMDFPQLFAIPSFDWFFFYLVQRWVSIDGNTCQIFSYLTDNGIEASLEPLDGVVAVDSVLGTDLGLAAAAAGDALTGTGHAAVEVHAVDTDRGVILDAEIDVLRDTEAEVAGLGEVALAQLVLLDLEATLENLLGLGATDCDVDGNLFVTADTEGTDGVTGLAC